VAVPFHAPSGLHEPRRDWFENVAAADGAVNLRYVKESLGKGS